MDSARFTVQGARSQGQISEPGGHSRCGQPGQRRGGEDVCDFWLIQAAERPEPGPPRLATWEFPNSLKPWAQFCQL